MRAMIFEKPVSLNEVDTPLRLVDLPTPEPTEGEVRLRVQTCGVCHTEIDEIEGRLLPSRLPMVLGHEIVGIVDELGPKASRLQRGQRVGVGWIHHSTGHIDENLSPEFLATGRDAFGGYAEYMTVPEDYAFPIPETFTDEDAAPLLCAGAIGYRSLRLAQLENGQPLGLMGFGGSAHLVLQLARHLLPKSPVFVFARSAQARELAETLGAHWTGGIADQPPTRPHAIIDTTPAWTPVVEALRSLAPGGRLVINAIRKEDFDKSRLLDVSYHDHLWMEREIKSVANVTGADIRDVLAIAAEIPLRPRVEAYPLEDANRALVELKRQPTEGAKVLRISG